MENQSNPNPNLKEEPGLADDLRDLGNNLVDLLRTAWDRPERKKLREEIESGLSELGVSLNKASEEIKKSEVGKKLKSGVHDFKTRAEEKKVEETIRSEVKNALSQLNKELQKLTSTLSDFEPTKEPPVEPKIEE